MPIRVHGGVNTNQVLTGSLWHFKIVGADFTGAVDAEGQPVYNSAADIVAREISKRATIAIMDTTSSTTGMSLALETNRASWTAETMQEMIRSLGSDVGVDHVDLSDITVAEVPYGEVGTGGSGTATTFLELTDTPSSYTGHAGETVVVNPAENRLIFAPMPPPGIGDAPIDGNLYGRQDAAWVEVPPSGISDAPVDGNLYGRQDADWVEVPPSIDDAPVDGNLYGRQDETWVEVPPSIDDAPADGKIYGRQDSAWTEVQSSVTGDIKYVDAIPGQTLLKNTKYIARSLMTLILPDAASVEIGDTVVVAKSVSVSEVTVNSTAGQLISTDLGDDTSIIIDVTNNSIFIYDGSVWNLEVASIRNSTS